MKQTDNLFWTAWAALVIVMVIGRNELWRLFACPITWLCHRVRPGTAFVNMMIVFIYNAILVYNLVLNNLDGTGLTWRLYLLSFNDVHSAGLLINCNKNILLEKIVLLVNPIST